jgi:hypothetical protein
MKISSEEYALQISKAKETLEALETYHKELAHGLVSYPGNAILNRELEKLLLDMIITENELEHAQSEWLRLTTKRAV